MKMSSEKQTSGSRRPAKDESVFQLLRARGGSRRGVLRTKDFWRALSSASFASPQGTVPPRLHD
jgi:hypothetical protein